MHPKSAASSNKLNSRGCFRQDAWYLKQHVHPVSITRFPLRRFSPGAGLRRNPYVHR